MINEEITIDKLENTIEILFMIPFLLRQNNLLNLKKRYKSYANIIARQTLDAQSGDFE